VLCVTSSRKSGLGGEVHSEWEIYRARLRSLEYREPVLKFSPEVNKQIGIDIAEFKGAQYKQFDDLLDGIFCAYLAYYFWHSGEEGCWVVGDLETGYVTLPRCRLSNCPLHANAMLVSAAPE
jgi:predicted RNase H-like nuclease